MKSTSEIRKILEASTLLLDTDEICKEGEHTIDMKLFDNHPIVKAAVKKLNEAGIDAETLRTKGFIPAFMLYGHLLKK